MYQYYTENMDERAKNMMDKNYVTALLQYVNRIDDIRGDTHRTFTEKA
jgi:flagellar basal-body rod modification protein FlgD